VIELEVDEIGPSLRYASAKVTRTQRSSGQGGNFGGAQQGGWGGQSQQAPWGGQQQAGPSDWGTGQQNEPPF
jgi:single-strand DNA-binding protein